MSKSVSKYEQVFADVRTIDNARKPIPHMYITKDNVAFEQDDDLAWYAIHDKDSRFFHVLLEDSEMDNYFKFNALFGSYKMPEGMLPQEFLNKNYKQ